MGLRDWLRHNRRLWLWSACILLVLLSLPRCEKNLPHLYPPPTGKGIPVYVVDHGWHAGLVIPTVLARTALPSLPAELLRGPYLEIGWGDEGFYKAGSFDNIDLELAARALLLPTPSVLHLVAVPALPQDYFPTSRIVEVQLSQPGLEQMLGFIHQTFLLDPQGRPQDAGAGIYGDSRFYRARPSYHLLRTCNHWTAQGLRNGGLPITPAYAFRVENLIGQLVALNSKKH